MSPLLQLCSGLKTHKGPVLCAVLLAPQTVGASSLQRLTGRAVGGLLTWEGGRGAHCVLHLPRRPLWTSFLASVEAVAAFASLTEALQLAGRFLTRVSPLDLQARELLGAVATW